jgi:hypothetical protein
VTDERGPYRSSGGNLPCPRCGDALLLSGTSFVCGRDCGEWLEPSSLRDLPLGGDLGVRQEGGPGAPPSPLSCPRCGRPLDARAWGYALFEQCAGHGVWLAARFRSAFHMQVAAAIEEEREITALAARIDAASPEGRRELARRILAIERRLAALERRTQSGGRGGG